MKGCLLLHGFTGSPEEVRPLMEYLSFHTDWKLVCPVLPGHEEDSSLKKIRYQEWVDAAEASYFLLQKECDTIFVVGFSMGGMIAAHLAVTYKIEKLILLSAAAFYVSPRYTAADVGMMILDAVTGKLTTNEVFLRYRTKVVKTPVRAALQFQALVKNSRANLEKITIPTFIAHCLKDSIVPVKSARFIYDAISSEDKTVMWLDERNHLICHCDNRNRLFEEIHFFLKGSFRDI